MTNPQSPSPSSENPQVNEPHQARARYLPRHSSPSGKVSWQSPAPGVAGAGLRRGAPTGGAAAEGGPQPEEKTAPPRARRARASSTRTRKRYPKPPALKRSYVCSVRLNDEEHEHLSAAARAVGASLPAFLARAGSAAAADAQNAAAAVAGQRELVSELFAARRHLGQVSNNLNQVARAINSGDRPSEVDVVLDAVHRAVQRVQDATDQFLDRN